jgi:membrane-bound serine protease (ClpP class)
MKNSILLFISFIFVIQVLGQNKVLVFPIKETIAPPVVRSTWKAMQYAKTIKADYILVEMDTYGGMVDAADSIRTMLLNSSVPVFVLIKNNAASAGALISLACDSIYMQPGSTMGAATVVDQNGQQVPDKFQSYMRSKMRATAEKKGRNPDIAEAMVDPDKFIEGISDSGKVLTLTYSEAVKLKMADAIVNNSGELFKRAFKEKPVVIYYQSNLIETIIGWLIHPAVSGILLLIIVGGVYFELQTPGVGFPILAAAIASVFYFAPLYLEGLALNWEIAVFIGGIILIVVELFVIPGFGFIGISGIVLAFFGLMLSLIENVDLDFSMVKSASIIQSFAIVMSALLGATVMIFWWSMHLVKLPILKKAVLATDIKSSKTSFLESNDNSKLEIGMKGKTLTPLKLHGKAEINGKIIDVFSENTAIDIAMEIEITRIAQNKIYVQKISA